MSKSIYLLIVLIGISVPSCSQNKEGSVNNSPSTNNLTHSNNQSSNSTNNQTGVSNNGMVGQSTSGATETDQVDILWVIDNSGSMCQEQDLLQQQFNLFVEGLKGANKDFHIALTTTHMTEDYAPEPVAKPGHIQSTPQPIPGFDRSCILNADDMGFLIEGDFQPLKNAIHDAVNCMETPDQKYNQFTDADFACASSSTGTCDIAELCGPRIGNRCSLRHLFPAPSSYRKIANVLKSADYQKDGELDIARLKEDFACMSFVGTRGNGIEKGLSALVLATSEEKTGGPVEDPTRSSAPNHGFLRQNAKFAAVFLSDENDCSHNGMVDESSVCGDATCEYANIEGEEDQSPLLKIADIKAELLANLRASKKRPDLNEQDIYLASIQGRPMRFSGQPLACTEGETGVQPSCNANGRIFSGDRYTRFLQSFPDTQIYPKRGDSEQGWLCVGDFSPALQKIGELFAQ